MAADAIASAVEDAVIGGDVLRARALARQFEQDEPSTPPPATARVLLALGVLEQNSGSVPQAAMLLRKAAGARYGHGAAAGARRARPRSVTGWVGAGVAEAADALAAVADLTDPEQEMLTATPGRPRWPSPAIGSRPARRACGRWSCWNPNPRSGTIRGIW